MTEPTRKSLVLVADDEEEWQNLIRDSVEELNARVIVARNVQEACQLAAKHDPKSKDALDLVILDMWMPLDAGPIPKTEEARKDKEEKEQEGGIAFLRSYRLVKCPIIVFTQWPSFANCVKAAREGAWAYVSKRELESMEWGITVLQDLCRQYLPDSSAAKTAPTSSEERFPQSVPSKDWLGRNYEWLRRECSGQWVALVSATAIQDRELEKLEREGVAVIRGDSYEAVRELVVGDHAVLGQSPEIVFVP